MANTHRPYRCWTCRCEKNTPRDVEPRHQSRDLQEEEEEEEEEAEEDDDDDDDLLDPHSNSEERHFTKLLGFS